MRAIFDEDVIAFKRLENGAGLEIPAYATNGAAGMDIRAAHNAIVNPGATTVIDTGFAVAIPEGYELQCRPRSGLARKHGITIVNAPGTVDSDYRGEISIILHNLGSSMFYVARGDRIAQLVLAEVPRLPVIEVSELDETTRGAGGFGSTGRN